MAASALIFLLVSTATTAELDGPRVPFPAGESVEPDQVHVLEVRYVKGELRLVDDVVRTPGGRLRLGGFEPGADVHSSPTESTSYSVVRYVRGHQKPLSWVEFFEVVGDEEEADRRARNRVLSYLAFGGGSVLLIGGVFTGIFVQTEEIRYSAIAAAGTGLVAFILGFFTSDDAPAREDVAKTIERYNASLAP
jgi:hypothetical protein